MKVIHWLDKHFEEGYHVRGYLPVGDLGVDLRAVDIRMAHHPGDALYRNARGQCQGPERMPGRVEYTR